jgi:O-antigen/teichoic acid export membrane protein
MINRLLDRIGKYLQLDLYYYIKNFLYLITALGGTDLARFALSIAFARLVTQNLYGQWNFIFSVFGICAIFTLPGIGTAITRSVSTGHDRTLVRGTKQRFKWSVLGTFVVIGVGLYYWFTGEVVIGKSLIISSLFFPFYHSLLGYASFFSGKKQFDKVAKYQLITQAVSILVTVGVIYFSRNLILIVMAYLLSFSVLRGYFFRLAYRNMENRNDDPSAVPYGRHLTVTLIPTEIRQYYDRIIIALFISFQELAIYAVALGFADVIYSFSSIIATLILPKLSQMDKETAYREVKKRWPLLILGFGIVCGILIALSPYIIPFFYSAKYAGSVFYAQLLLISVIIAAPVPIINKALFPSQKRVSELYRLRIYGSIIEIILLTVLALKFGLLGVVIAVILGRAFTTLYSLKLAGFISFRR